VRWPLRPEKPRGIRRSRPARQKAASPWISSGITTERSVWARFRQSGRRRRYADPALGARFAHSTTGVDDFPGGMDLAVSDKCTLLPSKLAVPMKRRG